MVALGSKVLRVRGVPTPGAHSSSGTYNIKLLDILDIFCLLFKFRTVFLGYNYLRKLSLLGFDYLFREGAGS